MKQPKTSLFSVKATYNKSIKFARKERGLDAAQKTRSAPYFSRYISNANCEAI